MAIKKVIAICIIALVSIANASAQDVGKFQSIFVYTFAKYIEWPKENQTGDFVIGVLGESAVLEHLEKMSTNKTKGTQKIRIKKLNSIKGLAGCHIVFIGRNKSGLLEDVRNVISAKNSLIVTEKPGMCSKGSDLNFIMQGNKLRFEMNKNLMNHPKLKVSNELTKFAIII